jgi:energy-coupling factor transport system substrate-specific component
VALIAGAGAGIAESVLDLTVWYPGVKFSFVAAYAISTTISGIVIAGLGSWLIVKALAKTGALSRFASGREVTARV